MRNYGNQENTFTGPDSRFPSHDDTSKTTRPRSTRHVPAEPLAGFSASLRRRARGGEGRDGRTACRAVPGAANCGKIPVRMG